MGFYIYNIIKIIFIRECKISHCPARKSGRVFSGQVAQDCAKVFNKDTFYRITNSARTVHCPGRQEIGLLIEKSLDLTLYLFVRVCIKYPAFFHHGNLFLNNDV